MWVYGTATVRRLSDIQKDYNRLFFEHTNEYLGGAMKEFYQMFPQNINEANQFFFRDAWNSRFLGT